MDGILLVDKPAGPTSHDVVDLVRKRFALPKVGHTGTLDPIATGLLVLTLGRATKLTENLTAQSKDYEATLLLGMSSATQDIQGAIVQQAVVPKFSSDEIENVVASFRGEQEQIPPMFSAVKKNGKKLYELARKGKEIFRAPKKVVFFELRLEDICLPKITFFVSCSKGTYIRTLCHDIGAKLGCGGVLYSLRRLRLGPFHTTQATSLKELLQDDFTQLAKKVIPIFKIEDHARLKTV